MIITVRDEESEELTKQLVQNNFTPTHIATTGEFLHLGKSIFLLGVEEVRVDEVKKIIESCTSKGRIREGESLQAISYTINSQMIQK